MNGLLNDCPNVYHQLSSVLASLQKTLDEFAEEVRQLSNYVSVYVTLNGKKKNNTTNSQRLT
jgi:hypothetical protein